jgi:hypothetical protein
MVVCPYPRRYGRRVKTGRRAGIADLGERRSPDSVIFNAAEAVPPEFVTVNAVSACVPTLTAS